MRQRRISKLLVGALAAFLLVGVPRTGHAAIVFDDHFTGNSGGMPGGWSLFVGPGAAVESGTTVTLDHDIIIWSTAVVDPSRGTVTITWEIAGVCPEVYSLALLLSNASLSSAIAVGLEPSDGGFRLAVDALNGGEWQDGGWGQQLPGYTGGALRLTIVLEPTEFTVSSESPPVSSGPVEYATAFPTFTLDDLGTTCVLILQNDAPSSDPAFSIVDRITVDIEPPVAVEVLSFGQVKALYRH